MLKIKKYFSAESSEYSYSHEFKRLLVIIIIVGVFVASDILIKEANMYNNIKPYLIILIRLTYISVYLTALLLIFISLARLINISDNKEKKLIKNGEKKFKHKPLKYRLEDVILVFENYDIPDIVYIKDQMNKIHTIELSMDYDERKNVFNRQYHIDNMKFVDITEFKEYIINNSMCDEFENVLVVSLIDNNNPILFERVISQCKKKVEKSKN